MKTEHIKEIEIPGIDDCDMLYVISSKDGEDSIYIKCQEVGGEWYCQCVIDCNTGRFCDDFGGQHGPFKTSAEACLAVLGDVEDWFMDNNRLPFFRCNNTKRVLKNYRAKMRRDSVRFKVLRTDYHWDRCWGVFDTQEKKWVMKDTIRKHCAAVARRENKKN